MTQDREITIAWAAGLFDGEGSISIVGNRVQTVIEMTDLDLLERVQKNFGGKIYKLKTRQEHWKQAWRWQISSTKKAVEFLEIIYPYLGVRRKHKVDEAKRIMLYNRFIKAEQKRDSILELYRGEEELTQKAIAEIVGCTREHVNRIIAKYGGIGVKG